MDDGLKIKMYSFTLIAETPMNWRSSMRPC